MRIFGDILPFVGWRTIAVDNDGEPSEEGPRWQADALEVEWLGAGAVLYIKNVRAVDSSGAGTKYDPSTEAGM